MTAHRVGRDRWPLRAPQPEPCRDSDQSPPSSHVPAPTRAGFAATMGGMAPQRTIPHPYGGKSSPRKLDRLLADLAARQHGVVARRQLLEAGAGPARDRATTRTRTAPLDSCGRLRRGSLLALAQGPVDGGGLGRRRPSGAQSSLRSSALGDTTVRGGPSRGHRLAAPPPASAPRLSRDPGPGRRGHRSRRHPDYRARPNALRPCLGPRPHRPRARDRPSRDPAPLRPALSRRPPRPSPRRSREQGAQGDPRREAHRRRRSSKRARRALSRLPRQTQAEPTACEHARRDAGRRAPRGRLRLARPAARRRARRSRHPRDRPRIRARPSPRPSPRGRRMASRPHHLAPAPRGADSARRRPALSPRGCRIPQGVGSAGAGAGAGARPGMAATAASGEIWASHAGSGWRLPTGCCGVRVPVVSS